MDDSSKHSSSGNVNTTPYFNAKEAPPPYSEYQESLGSVPSSYTQSYGPTPPPGFQSYPVQTAPGPIRNYGTTTVVITQPSDIVIVGGCPACRVGVLEDDYTCLGIFCAIFFFPLGILCCLALKDKRCSNCGAYFG